MISFIQQLKERNTTLFFFGLFCLFLAVVFFVTARMTNIQVNGINAWYKPFKFAFSTLMFAWTMAWYCSYLPNIKVSFFNWSVIILLGFEIVYIALQAGRGQLSHYNISTPIYATLFSLMAIAATLVTTYTAYIGFLFFKNNFPELPSYYVLAIRFSILLFVIFSLEGFAMGSKLSHSIGSINDNSNLFILGWSKTVGDLRVAHFIGMHALQVLPFVSYYFLKSNKFTVALAIIYGLLAVFTLVQALNGKPLLFTLQCS